MGAGQTFNYSFSTDQRGSAPDDDQFAVAGLGEFHLGGEAMLARNPGNGRRMVLAAEVLNALTHCNSFRTLDEHVANLLEGGDGAAERARAIRAILQSVRDGGLVLEAADLCRELAPATGAPAAPATPVVAIITCDRSAALQRLLQSISTACDLEQVHHFYVVDDSRATDQQQDNHELMRRFGAAAPCPVGYVGADAARQFSDTLCQRLPRLEQEIRFLTDRERWTDFISTGVTRNLAQLLSVGRPLIVFDDDAVCRLYAPDYARQGFEISAGRRQALFFESIEEQEARRIRDDADAVRRLNRCLGLTLPEALAAMGARRLEQQAWRHADSGFAAQLSRHSRIRVTECGTFGDPGTQDYAWLAALPEETLRRIAGDPRQAELAMRNSPCWLGVERTSFVPTANFSQVTGFDNRDFLPPYFPFERGQDRVFGETVRFLFPGSVALVHPWAVLHQRVTGTGRAQALQQRWNPGGFPGFLTYAPLERAGASHAGDLPTRLAGLAAAFADLGHSPQAALLRLHAELQLRDQSQRLAGLRKSLELSGGASPEWADWLEQDLRKTRAATQREPAMPANSAEILALWQTAWRAFGRALAAWPAIRDAAGELGGEGRPGGERPAWD